MRPEQNAKWVAALNDVEKAGGFTAFAIDTQGFEHAEIVAAVGDLPLDMEGMEIQESDDPDDSSSFAAIVGTRVGVDKDVDGNTSSLPTATYADMVIVWQLDLNKRKRYLALVVTAGENTDGDKTQCQGLCRLARGSLGVVTSTQTGASHVMRVN